MATRAKAGNGEGIPFRELDRDGNPTGWWKAQWTLKDGNGRTVINAKGNAVRPLVRERTEQAVRLKRDKIKREAAGGAAPTGMRAKNVMVPDVVEAWMKATGEGKAATSLAARDRAYRRAIKPQLKVRAEELNKARLESFLRKVAASATGPGVIDGRATAKTVFDVVHAAMAWGESEEGAFMVKRNQIARMRFPLGASRTRKEVPVGDIGDIVAAAAGKPSQLLWRLFLATGARRGEITGLDVEHVNVRKREIKIRQIATPESGGRKVDKRTKTGTHREIDIPEDVMKDLAALIAGRGPKEAVFVGPRSPRLSFPTLREWFIRDMKAAGIHEYTPHQLRHTFATEALSMGHPTKVVQEILGHSSPTTTMEVYAHVKAGAKEAAIKDVASSIATAVANSIANKAAARAAEALKTPVNAGI